MGKRENQTLCNAFSTSLCVHDVGVIAMIGPKGFLFHEHMEWALHFILLWFSWNVYALPGSNDKKITLSTGELRLSQVWHKNAYILYNICIFAYTVYKAINILSPTPIYFFLLRFYIIFRHHFSLQSVCSNEPIHRVIHSDRGDSVAIN